jgi:uncharacterized integral membrane protein
MTNSRMQILKLVVVAIVIIAVIIIIAQNTAAVDTRLLFVTVTMPRALLLILTLATGFVLGLFFSTVIIQRKKQTQPQ